MAPSPRSWMIELNLRAFALLFNLVGLILVGLGGGIHYVAHVAVFCIVAAWSFIQFILLICHVKHHPAVSLAFDLVSVILLLAFGFLGVSVAFYLDLHDNAALTQVGFILSLIAAIFHFGLFVQACVNTHMWRLESKRRDFERSKDNRV